MEDVKKMVGSPLSRIDGILKVTGKADYSLDHPIDNVAYAVLVKSTIAAGKIREVNSAQAEKTPGVLAVISHQNSPKLNEKGGIRGGALLQSPEIKFFGQTIGMVVAETFEQAIYAASLVEFQYQEASPQVNFESLASKAMPSKDREDEKRGDARAALNQASLKIEEVYSTPIEHHHPMEPHAAIAEWEGDRLTLYSSAQIVNGAQNSAAKTLNIKPENVRIVTPYIGGGFGSKGGQWANLVLTAVAAKVAMRPVKLALTRHQMVNSVGLRQRNQQKISLAATADGKLMALAHETTTHSAIDEEFVEPCGDCSKLMYDTPNSLISYRVVPMNVILPTYTRGPGKSTGSFALESGMDELAHKLNIDPIEFRLRNEPARDPSNGKPWSTRATAQCLKEGAKAFGWEKRKAQPRQNEQGDYWVGHGVACGTYPAHQRPSSANVLLKREGSVVQATVELAAADLGTGTYTILAQTAADALGIPVDKIVVKIGDSDLPPAAGSVGSVGAMSYANVVNDVCQKATEELIAKSGKQFFARPTAAQLMVSEKIENFQSSVQSEAPASAEEYSSHSFNANFAEVWVHKFTGMVRVNRFLAVTGAGRILNPKTARSQIIGGNVWGIGMALTEESAMDPRWGNFVSRSLADYHIPANLDIGEMEVIFIREDDTASNKLGVKGIGEVGIVGVAAAVANAVFNATGKRVRELPITPDKLI
ncbi:xanthine dehydrogenase family protein molybdopterin-binding subunit [Persicitalea jodogahamensis]|uniref:Xanthine dehydrogenase n=1 Tax=Persicitalea jodogahamensis TaxID=402147 RepID=A0A8J3D6H4_9BACT|nr:xanthine dehydrogenase family protein molybdopterin-binding subunit [Persicitalea jodogahamensis]GHB81394.1 xanthine dehydrogenase [Persicitalea jodogahamensis]